MGLNEFHSIDSIGSRFVPLVPWDSMSFIPLIPLVPGLADGCKPKMGGSPLGPLVPFYPVLGEEVPLLKKTTPETKTGTNFFQPRKSGGPSPGFILKPMASEEGETEGLGTGGNQGNPLLPSG